MRANERCLSLVVYQFCTYYSNAFKTMCFVFECRCESLCISGMRVWVAMRRQSTFTATIWLSILTTPIHLISTNTNAEYDAMLSLHTAQMLSRLHDKQTIWAIHIFHVDACPDAKLNIFLLCRLICSETWKKWVWQCWLFEISSLHEHDNCIAIVCVAKKGFAI